MIEWFRHETDGRITTVGGCAEGEEHFYTYEGETLVVGPRVDPYRHWFDVGSMEVKDREPSGITRSGLAFANIPVPCDLRILGPETVVEMLEEPTLELSFDVPGTYRVEFEPVHPRWLPETFEVTV
jgi:hypothetical protein